MNAYGKFVEDNVSVRGHEGFYKALEEFSPKTQQWANEIYSAYQKEILRSKFQTLRGGKSRLPGKKIKRNLWHM